MTGLNGRYDFTINIMAFVPPMEARRTAPVDPLDVFREALEQELGLRLESRKVAVEMLVVDHLAKSPKEN
jgi:uncharacterized protein (TIGR03435 family)